MVTHDPELARRAHRSVHVLDGTVVDLQAATTHAAQQAGVAASV